MKSPKEECEELMNSVVPFAEQMLSQHREFYPFGGAMAPDGRLVAVGGHVGSEHPPSADVVALLEEGLRQGAKEGAYKATALVIDMLVVPPGKNAKQDAIAVRLDHRDRYSIVVMFPYAVAATGHVTLEAPFAMAGEERIFPR